MQLQLLDIFIILSYLSVTIGIGLYLRKQAQANKSNYLLGGNTIPWYMLSLSNASGMFDISGTMWLVTITFIYGFKSIWIPWLWPVFNQIFMMVYLSQWLRRSGVTTGAEWINFRFGNSKGSELSHIVVVVFAVVSCIGFLAYGFIGLGKFVEIFIPWSVISPYIPFEVSPQFVPHFYGIIFTCFAVFYSLLAGMKGVVLTDLIQYIIMTISAIIVGVLGYQAVAAGNVLNVPDGWSNPFFGWHLNLDWSGFINGVNDKIDQDGYELFSILFTLMLFKGFLVSAAGPAPNYDMQKVLATRSPREASLMSGFVSLILIPARYLMIIGFTVLAIIYFDQLGLNTGGIIDFEQILPAAISKFVPVGLAGLLLAGLLAAFMSTFAGTLNAAQAYLINDVYLKYMRPDASQKQMSFVNYSVGMLVVVVSVIIGFYAMNINSILQWIVSGLWGGYIASNVFKWYWWRFNANGYFWGMVAGLVPALVMPKFLPDLFPSIAPDIIILYFFLVLLVLAIAGCLIGTYSAPPTDMEVLKKFYVKVRPWGFWKPIHEEVLLDNPDFQVNTNFWRDVLNIGVGIIWQTSLVVVPLCLVTNQFYGFGVALAIVLITSYLLKINWYDKLQND